MSITKREVDGRSFYLVRWRDPDGVQRSKSFKKQRDARAWDAERIRLMNRGAWASKGASSKTVREIVEWRGRTSLAIGAATKHNYLTKNLGSLANVKVSNLKSGMIQEWVNTLITGRPWHGGESLKPSTAISLLRVLSADINSLVKNGDLVANPCSTVRVPREDSSVLPSEIPDMDWIVRVAEAAERRSGPSLRAMILLSASTGMRVAEVCGLRWSCVDRDSGVIRVEKQMSIDGRSLVPPKTRSSVRSIHPSPSAFDLLDGLPQLPDGLVFHRDGPHSFDRSGVWTSSRVSSALSHVRRDAGVSDEFSFHSLRHFFASHLLAHGATVKEVQEELGHEDASMTLDVYSHLTSGASERVSRAAPTF